MTGFLAAGLEGPAELSHGFAGVPWWLYLVLPILAIAIGIPLWNASAPPDIKQDMREQKEAYKRRKGNHRWTPLHQKKN